MSPADDHLDEETILAYVRGRLADDALKKWDRHLDACSPCRQLLAEVAKSSVIDDEEPVLAFDDDTQDASRPRVDGAIFAPGELVDQYRIIRTIGRGGMGEVFLARDTKLGRKVALKVILARHIASPSARERFLFEARATANLAHPHIVALYGVGEVQGRPYVALEYLEGESLRDRLDVERPSVWTTLRTGVAIANALSVAHDNGILHRDLKPENVILAEDGRLRVVDFGLAQAVSRDRSVSKREHGAGLMTRRPTNIAPLDNLNQMSGTPAYMAPEQWRGAETTASADVWSLGVLLYEMVTGHRPYGDDDSRIDRLRRDVLATSPVPTIDDARTLPARLPTLIYRCLAKDPARRPSAQDVADDLEALLRLRLDKVDASASPFIGTRAFDRADAPLYFGRETSVDGVVERLRVETHIIVAGPPGCGKSSFVRAGVVPRLEDNGAWTVIEVQPGPHPFRALSAAIDRARAKDDDGDEATTRLLVDGPGRAPLAVDLARLAHERRSRVLLVVDPLDDLFTRVDEDVQHRFLAALHDATDDRFGPVRVISTLREEHLARLADTSGRVFMLPQPDEDALLRIVEGSLHATDHTVDDPQLPKTIAAELAASPIALPLLQLTGKQLWSRRDAKERRLSRDAYVSFEGASGALVRHAESEFQSMPVAEQEVARRIFAELVGADGTRRAGTRAQLAEAVDGAASMIDRLVATHLLATTRDGALQLSSDALMDRWSRASAWKSAPMSARRTGPRWSTFVMVIAALLLVTAAVFAWRRGASSARYRAAWVATTLARARAPNADARTVLRGALEMEDDEAFRRAWAEATKQDPSEVMRVDYCALMEKIWAEGGAPPPTQHRCR
ncbi:MAG: serine/threonine-protein kinase [Deltaproteobacteria bacterium]|jgi:serine/threonine protein kinase